MMIKVIDIFYPSACVCCGMTKEYIPMMCWLTIDEDGDVELDWNSMEYDV